MKPQLFTADSGIHNNNIEASAQRILEGGSWKKQRVIMILPASAQIPTKVAMSLWSLVTPPNQGVFRMAALGMEVGEAYSNAIQEILNHPELSTWEYILTVEHDNIPPSDGLVKLIQDMEQHPEYSCIGGLYWTKGEGGVPQIWGDPTDPQINFRPQVPRVGQIQECCGTGMGFNLWRVSMFKDPKIEKPWFKTICGSEGVGTQDLHFWAKARNAGYRCAIDNNVLVGHFSVDTDIIW